MKRCILPKVSIHQFYSLLTIFLLCYLFVASPVFGQGKLVAKKAGSTPAPWGYYEYLPKNYYQKSKHPILIFLSGIGEKGNGTTDLPRVLKHGPPKLINKGQWPSSRPFIVIAPQSPGGFYNPGKLRDLINHIKKTYRADANRIYLTGLSAGGISTWNYIAEYQDQIAAAVPICGSGKNVAKKTGCKLNKIAIWAFHGSSDPTVNVSGSIMAVESINACSPKPNPRARLTIYPGVKHDAWTKTYDLGGMHDNTDKKYDPYNKNIYDWMLSHSTNGSAPPPTPNQPPVAKAGEDIFVDVSVKNVTLQGNGSYDSDGKIVSYAWTKIAGPNAKLSGKKSSKLTVSNLSKGAYKFRLTVKDNDGASNADEVSVTVNKEDIPTGNHGLSYQYYEGRWSKLPDFSKLKAAKNGKISTFSLSPRKRNENFGFAFTGFIKIDKSGVYTFYTTSDDGTRLYINGKEVVDNDGLHGKRERSGKVKLTKGYHAIKVKYFEQAGYENLSVKYAGPGIGKKEIPGNKLYTKNPSDDTPAPAPPPTNGQGLAYRYYEGSWNKLPDFSKLKAVKTGKTDGFDLSQRKRNDNFAFVFEGYIMIDKAGLYRFISKSDDGSKLYIDNKVVVNNDGIHQSSFKAGTLNLTKGLHAIKVCYFEKNGREKLKIKYNGPGMSKRFIPKSKLFLSKNGAPAPENPKPEPKPEPKPNPPGNDKDMVAKFYLINPGNNKILGELKPGSEVVAGNGFNIEAVTNPGKVGSVKFFLNNKHYRTEGVAPYAMGGDKKGNFAALKLSPGNYKLKAIPYAENKAKGKAGKPLEIKFRVIKGKNTGLNARTIDRASDNALLTHNETEASKIESVYPNPIEDKIHVQFNNMDAAGKPNFKLLNYMGVAYEHGASSAIFSNNELVIDIAPLNLSAGVYLLQVTYNNGAVTEIYRVIKK